MVASNLLQDAICGGVGAFSCTYVGLPFDTVKVRLQTSGPDVFAGPTDACLRTVREEGVRALWKGAIPALASALTENLVVFAANGVIRRSLTRAGVLAPPTPGVDEYHGFWTEAAMGGASGFFSAAAICPAEVLKCRLQVNRGVGCNPSPAGLTAAAAAGSTPHCPGLAGTAAELWRTEGGRGFFRGLTALWCRDVPFYVAFFAAYKCYIDAAMRWQQVATKQDLAMANLHYVVGGGIAGSCGWALVFPIDVIKSRTQVGALPASLPVWKAAATLLRTEGWAALRGWAPAVLRGFPANGALFLGVETAQGFFRRAEGPGTACAAY